MFPSDLLHNLVYICFSYYLHICKSIQHPLFPVKNKIIFIACMMPIIVKSVPVFIVMSSFAACATSSLKMFCVQFFYVKLACLLQGADLLNNKCQ